MSWSDHVLSPKGESPIPGGYLAHNFVLLRAEVFFECDLDVSRVHRGLQLLGVEPMVARGRRHQQRSTSSPGDEAKLTVMASPLLSWLRDQTAGWSPSIVGVFRENAEHQWPITAASGPDLRRVLTESGHLLPLPTEPAALANVMEIELRSSTTGTPAHRSPA